MIEKNKKKLLKANISNAHNEINRFLEKKFNFTREQIYFKQYTLNKNQINVFNNFINRRIKEEPFQYILNISSFCGLDLYVDSNVLIPRPETELIINILIKNNFKFKSALDIGTGSGNLAIALSKNNISENITALDNSKKALKVANKNLKKHNVKNVKLEHCDYLQKNIYQSFDLLVCNPPYISKKEYIQLESGVKTYEPKSALTDNLDGLTFYYKIKNDLHDLVKKNGMILLEIGYEKYKPKISDIFKDYSTKWHKDLNGDFRVIQIFR